MAARQIAYTRAGEFLLLREYDLTGQALRAALLNSTYHPIKAWQASNAYPIGATIQPTSPNGHYYRAESGGDSDPTEPGSWPVDGSTVVDGDLVWRDLGIVLPEYGGEDYQFSQIQASEISGTGYSPGGILLNNTALDVRPDRTILTADDLTIALANFSARWLVLYQDATVSSIVKPLIAAVLLNDAPADIVVVDGPFNYNWSLNGVLTVPPTCG